MNELTEMADYISNVEASHPYDNFAMKEDKPDSYYIERDQEVRIRATKLWLEFILAINKMYMINGKPYIPTTKELSAHIELFGNYILNGTMEMNIDGD